MQPDSNLNINAVEGFALEDFSADVSFLSSVVSGMNMGRKIVEMRTVGWPANEEITGSQVPAD